MIVKMHVISGMSSMLIVDAVKPRSWHSSRASDRRFDEGLEWGQGLHRLGLAVDQESLFDVAAGLLVPPAEIAAVGVAREAVEHIDRGVQVVPLIEDLNSFDAVGDGRPRVPSAW